MHLCSTVNIFNPDILAQYPLHLCSTALGRNTAKGNYYLYCYLNKTLCSTKLARNTAILSMLMMVFSLAVVIIGTFTLRTTFAVAYAQPGCCACAVCAARMLARASGSSLDTAQRLARAHAASVRACVYAKAFLRRVGVGAAPAHASCCTRALHTRVRCNASSFPHCVQGCFSRRTTGRQDRSSRT